MCPTLNFVTGYKDILLVHIIVTLGSSRGRVCPELLPELSVVLTEYTEEVNRKCNKNQTYEALFASVPQEREVDGGMLLQHAK